MKSIFVKHKSNQIQIFFYNWLVLFQLRKIKKYVNIMTGHQKSERKTMLL